MRTHQCGGNPEGSGATPVSHGVIRLLRSRTVGSVTRELRMERFSDGLIKRHGYVLARPLREKDGDGSRRLYRDDRRTTTLGSCQDKGHQFYSCKSADLPMIIMSRFPLVFSFFPT